MKLLEDATITLERNDLKRYPIYTGKGITEDRQSGVHVSGIYRELALQMKLFKAAAELEKESIPTRWAGGIAWEEFVLSLYPNVVWQPGSVQIDDVWMTCDGLTQPNSWSKNHILEECKCTDKKVQTGIQFVDVADNWLYLVQGRSYCKGYESVIVRWHVYYTSGDYRGSGPIYKRFVVEFTPAEIESNWQMLVNHKHLATPE